MSEAGKSTMHRPEVYRNFGRYERRAALQLRKGTELSELLFYVLSLTDQLIVLLD